MRGAVTVAAAQTLPETTPQRSVLVLVAFLVATVSLLVQGGLLLLYGSAELSSALDAVDVEQIGLEMRGGPEG